MSTPQNILTALFSQQNLPFSKKEHGLFIIQISEKIQNFSPTELADLFVNAALSSLMMQFILDEHWLHQAQAHRASITFQHFVSQFFACELSTIPFLQEKLSHSSTTEIKLVGEQSRLIEKIALDTIKQKNFHEQKYFAQKSLALMSELFEFENQLQVKNKSQYLDLHFSMYRTFDGLDEVFNLNYQADLNMKVEPQQTERLYEGAGVGVQSGYSTVMTALRHLNPKNGVRFVDLGSGYGRVGFVIGLMRPDIDFKGYEYVPHRVKISAEMTKNFALSNHVNFFVQDLSLSSFRIPAADIYYLYDPFSEETYQHVLGQLIEISRQQKIFIATKGNTRRQLIPINEQENWKPPLEFDNGNLCLFESNEVSIIE